MHVPHPDPCPPCALRNWLRKSLPNEAKIPRKLFAGVFPCQALYCWANTVDEHAMSTVVGA